MRPRQLALCRIPIGSVTALAGSDGGRNDSGAKIDSADNVILTVGNVHDSVIGNRKPLWSGQAAGGRPTKSSQFGRAAVAGVATLAVSCDALQFVSPGIERKYAVPLSQREVDFAVLRKLDGPRSGQGRSRQCAFIRGAAALAVSSKRGHGAGLRINSAEAVIERVAYIEVAGRVKIDAVRLVE